MSRVRIYELAKEAGMESKVLAEQLIELGYNIKSHSSTVEDTVADEIRSKILVRSQVEIANYGELPRTQRKSRRVFDYRGSDSKNGEGVMGDE